MNDAREWPVAGCGRWSIVLLEITRRLVSKFTVG